MFISTVFDKSLLRTQIIIYNGKKKKCSGLNLIILILILSIGDYFTASVRPQLFIQVFMEMPEIQRLNYLRCSSKCSELFLVYALNSNLKGHRLHCVTLDCKT